MNLHALLKICNVIHWLALIIWLAALVSAGISAMNVFATLRKLDLTMNEYPALPAQSHGRLAAGMVMEGVFFVVDLLQFIAVPIAILTLLLQLSIFRMALRRPANFIRAMCLVVAAALFGYHAFALAPAMNRELRAYWTQAKAGEIDEAQSHLASFNAKHPVANTLLQVNLLLLFVGVAATAAALGPASPRRHGFESPALLKRQ